MASKYVKLNCGYCEACGTVLVSLHRHHMVECKCKELNKRQFVDGGFDYQRKTTGLKDLPLYWKKGEK